MECAYNRKMGQKNWRKFDKIRRSRKNGVIKKISLTNYSIAPYGNSAKDKNGHFVYMTYWLNYGW